MQDRNYIVGQVQAQARPGAGDGDVPMPINGGLAASHQPYIPPGFSHQHSTLLSPSPSLSSSSRSTPIHMTGARLYDMRNPVAPDMMAVYGGGVNDTHTGNSFQHSYQPDTPPGHGGGNTSDHEDDLLSSNLPVPDTTRRGSEHINLILDRIGQLENQHTPRNMQPVPWMNQLQVPGPELELHSQHHRPSYTSAPSQQDPKHGRFDQMRALREARHPARVNANGDGNNATSSSNEDYRKMLCELNGFSGNYKGDISNASNRSANVPDSMNTSLWIVGLHANMTYCHLLGCVPLLGRTGKIYATVISDAQPEKGHAGSAAKIVFFDRAGAQRVKTAIDEGRLNGVVGRSVRATYNRIRSAPQAASDASRVLFIRGPKSIVSREALDDLFSERFVYQTECVLVLEEDAYNRTLEWRFGSYRSQSQSAGMLLCREYRDTIAWAYAPDPCDQE